MSKYLKHHGTKGQRWGTRRFQNEDGTWTEEGKARRRGFRNAKREVVEKLSNNPPALQKQKASIKDIMHRGNVSKTVATKCAAIAEKIYDDFSKDEPRITDDVVSAVSQCGASMYGLEHRMKEPTSIAGKIASDSQEKSISYEEAATKLNDLIRYTAVSEKESFAKNYESIKKQLQDNGYEEIKCKNYYSKFQKGDSMHKALQSVYRNPDGITFELQYHTPESQAAKELKLPIYEERRARGISDDRATKLENDMRDLANQVPDPEGVYDILEHHDEANFYDPKRKTSDYSPAKDLAAVTALSVATNAALLSVGMISPQLVGITVGEIAVGTYATGKTLYANAKERSYEAERKNETVDEKTGFYLKNREMSIEEDIARVNPKFGTFDAAAQSNCYLCTTAYDMRRRGYDVRAEGATVGYTDGAAYKLYKNPKVEKYEFEKKRTMRKDLLKVLESQGEGARGNLCVEWANSFSGHSIAYEVKDGKALLIDAQSGKIMSNLDVTDFVSSIRRDVTITRLDNVKINPDELRKVLK